MAVRYPVVDELSGVLARLSGLLLTGETVRASLETVAALAHEAIPASVGAGVTLIDHSGVRVTSEATDPRVAQVDRMQYELDEGPCLTAHAERTMVAVVDTSTDAQFPRWSPTANGMGVAATLSAPLLAGGECLGAMKVYAEVAGAFDERSERLLRLFASHAAVLIANVQAYETAGRMTDQLSQAMLTRDAISTAKGMLMVKENLSQDQALRNLVNMASREHTSLRDVAHTVISAAQRRSP